jgi:hypothetical protein
VADDAIYFDDEELKAATSWHGGGGSMLYAISSTGALSRGTNRPRGVKTDEEWMVDLAERLENEATDAARDATKQAKKAKGSDRAELLADEEALRSIALKAAHFIHGAKRAQKSRYTTHATKYGKKASEKVGKALHEFKRGKLRSGSGGKVTSRKQAIAIGLEQARRAGGKVPLRPAHATRGKYPYIGYLNDEAVYVLGTTTRADEGIVGYDLRVRPVRLGKGPYTTVVDPDDVREK